MKFIFVFFFTGWSVDLKKQTTWEAWTSPVSPHPAIGSTNLTTQVKQTKETSKIKKNDFESGRKIIGFETNLRKKSGCDTMVIWVPKHVLSAKHFKLSGSAVTPSRTPCNHPWCGELQRCTRFGPGVGWNNPKSHIRNGPINSTPETGSLFPTWSTVEHDLLPHAVELTEKPSNLQLVEIKIHLSIEFKCLQRTSC